LIFPFALLARRMSRGAYALLLVMQSALYGNFTAQNFLLWFLFYEMSLVPAFLLIKIWGGKKRDWAATKFFLYSFIGSVAILFARRMGAVRSETNCGVPLDQPPRLLPPRPVRGCEYDHAAGGGSSGRFERCVRPNL